MRVSVDFDKCESNGLCVLAAPEIFDLDENNYLQYEPSPDSSSSTSVRDAAAACPVRAITVAE